MNNRPTPETDQFKVKFKTVCGEKYWVPLELSERLELELNEAWKELEEYRSIAESNGAVKAVCEKEKAIRERDEARDIGEKLSKQGLDMMDENRSLNRDRDEAREKIWRLEKQIEGLNNAANERFDEIESVRNERDEVQELHRKALSEREATEREADAMLERSLKAERERDEVRSLETMYQKVIAACLCCDPIPAYQREDDQLEPPWEVIDRIRRERDEAQEELEEYRSIAENIGAVKAVSEKEKAICERDEAWEKLKPLRQSLLDSQDEVLRLTFENRKIIQELDEARDTIMKIEEIFIDSEDIRDDWIKVGNIARTFCEK